MRNQKAPLIVPSVPSAKAEIGVFLESLFAGKPDELHILLWTLPEKKSHWFRSVEKAVRYAESCRERDIYLGVGLSKKDLGRMRRCPSEEIGGLVGVFADIDLRSDAHAKGNLPATIEQALSILPPELPPTFIILTGNGVHVWWLFKEHYVFENDQERKRAASLAYRWSTLIRDNARLRGWSIDRLGDLARVLRIPGTQNCKDPANPKRVTIHSCSDHRYNLSELLEYLDDMNVPDQDSENHAKPKWGQRFDNMPLSINLAARIPDDLLNPWLEKDPRFKNTWFRQRTDLRDPSQSGYDLALANFGVAAGLTDQQVIDLIIHHRAIHRQKPRTSLDYYQRALSKAASHGNDEAVQVAVGNPSSESQFADMPQPLPATQVSDRDKIAMCDRISELLGVEILRMVKLSGKEPLYRMELAEGKIEFQNVGKLIQHRAVREAIAAKVGKLIPPIKPKPWDQLVQLMLDACVVEEGGEELEWEGAIRMYLSQYLPQTTFISSIEGQISQNSRMPMVRDGRITVCAGELHMFITRTTQQIFSVRSVASMLSAIGARMVRVRGKKVREQSRWALPVEEFNPDDYEVSESETYRDRNA